MPNIHQSTTPRAKEGDLAQLVTERDKSHIFILKAGEEYQSHRGIIKHDDIIGLMWGSRIHSHLAKVFILLQPALDDLLRAIPRETQIMYPKDIGYIMVSMGIGPGSKVIEAGSGSGALTTAMAYAVGSTGQVISYENREKNLEIAKSNLERFGMIDRVTFRLKDISEGFDEQDAEAIFLDLPDPHNYIAQAREALIPGGFFGSILPTTNQVTELITALKKRNFEFIEVSEILHRYYKPTSTRLRPVDKMTAHTGYLLFARRITSTAEQENQK
jgi:tRNA (adenine57-N1/adenine58-N1)-methyltransferase